MRLSDDRINYLSHTIVRSLVRDNSVHASDEAAESAEIKKLMIKFLKNEEVVDQKARAKIASIKRGIPEGSREWDILYEQYYDEEMNKFK